MGGAGTPHPSSKTMMAHRLTLLRECGAFVIMAVTDDQICLLSLPSSLVASIEACARPLQAQMLQDRPLLGPPPERFPSSIWRLYFHARKLFYRKARRSIKSTSPKG